MFKNRFIVPNTADRKRIFLFPVLLLFLCTAISGFAQNVITGQVLDAVTRQPIAFVNVLDEKSRQGTACDIDGNFEYRFTQQPEQLRFSAVGYKTQTVAVAGTDKKMIVYLKVAAQLLTEVKIVAGDNPAHRIIRNAAENRNKNNPEKSLAAYSCTIYNKFYVTADIDPAADSLQRVDSLTKSKLEKLTARQHLFLSEAVSERKYIRPGRNSENVIASRVSGLKRTEFVLLSTQLQSFSFYTELVLVFSKPYLNPIADGAIGRYDYVLEDTLFTGADTVYIISYQPRRDKKFDGLKGSLAISSNGWAIQNVSAEPAANNSTFSVKIEQNYQQLNGKWFPVQLHTDWINKLASLTDSSSSGKNKGEAKRPLRMKAVSRSYITKAQLNPDLKKKEVGVNEVNIASDATANADSLLLLYRTDSLTRKDVETYRLIDSIGKAENFDRRLNFISVLATGKYPLGYLDFDIKHLMNYNRFEGYRLGAGLHTSRKLSRWFSVGGYTAYGFRDKAFKYGADAQLVLHQASQTRLKFEWSHDILESGGVFFRLDDVHRGSEAYRRLYREKFDWNEMYEASLRFRALHHFTFEFFGTQQERTGTDDYRFGITSENVTVLVNHFTVREAGISTRFAFREKFIDLLGFRISEGTSWPVLYLDVIKGISADLIDPDYLKCNLKISSSLKTKYLGIPALAVHAGYIKGNLPYSMLYAGRGSLGKWSVSVRNTFETMRPNEFLSDRYAALFYAHSYTFFPGKKFAPTLVLRSAALWGTLSNPASHYNYPFKVPEKGFYESGLELNNLFKSGFTGFGVAGFYRYGPYAGSSFKSNTALKLSLNLAF